MFISRAKKDMMSIDNMNEGRKLLCKSSPGLPVPIQTVLLGMLG